jgi:hypothetical protein
MDIRQLSLVVVLHNEGRVQFLDGPGRREAAREGFTYRNFLLDALGIFVFIVWFWLAITVFSEQMKSKSSMS